MKELISERSDLMARMGKLEVPLSFEFRKKQKKSNMVAATTISGKSGSDAQPVKFRGTIGAPCRPAKNLMGLRAPSTSI